MLFTGCLATLIANQQLRPHFTQLFFLPNPVLSIALLTAITMPLAVTHELAHWIGARVNGVPARIMISRRYYMMVLQTDLSALRVVERRRRFPPLVAGIAWDTVRLASLLAARSSQLTGWWHPSPLVARLTAALIVTHVFAISWQFFIFLRTDIYAVLVIGLGCLNMTKISQLQIASRYRRLNSAEVDELATASKQDRRGGRPGCSPCGGIPRTRRASIPGRSATTARRRSGLTQPLRHLPAWRGRERRVGSSACARGCVGRGWSEWS